MADSYIAPIYPQSSIPSIPSFPSAPASSIPSIPSFPSQPAPVSSIPSIPSMPQQTSSNSTGGSTSIYVPPSMAAQYGYDRAWQMLASQQQPQQSSSGITNIGQQTPAELARNSAIMNAPIDRTTSGGGGSSSTTSGGIVGATNQLSSSPNVGGLLKGLYSGGVSNYSNPTFGVTPYQTGGTLGYQSPPNQMNAPQGSGQLQMQQASPQQAINNYMNTPGYQLMFGQSAADRFHADPGYQYAVNDAMRNVQQNAASRGLLESGRVMRDMTDRAQNMANQQYGNWFNRQNQAYNDYQNRLAGLAGGPTGAEQANQLGQLSGQMNYQTGADLATLFGNQGSAGFGGMVNTGAAQAGNMTSSGNAQAQINATNQATQLAGATLGAGLF